MQLVGIFSPDIFGFRAAGRFARRLSATVGIEAWAFICRQS
jgi:hypothetical protein